MTRIQADELITEATVFLERDIDITILNNQNNFDRRANCKLKGWFSLSVSADKEQPSIDLYAKLADNNNSSKVYSPSLKSVVDEFKRLDGLNQG
jgi:ribonucleotide monophosphatase NagD (HAD superfamily)